ncbi:hypothetical protein MXD61_04210 [Frankia sp. AgPm24]|uniref:hypothetical protein n=1 Tax=Frankia sp. AgPm24 TaxID=631128 RepID=UPI00200FDB38|nr:hypothetical protein [Frankia sp. AgPm24]MCK9921119.1 hypothetical protein [Frankia sp. AgPm24]
MPGQTLEHFGYLLDRFETLLGRTPIKPIEISVQGQPRRIDLKLESYNITGSIKARTAYGLVRGLVDDGVLQNQITTQGNSPPSWDCAGPG